MTTFNVISAEELERMAPTDGRRELVRGELRSMPPAGFEHGAIVIRLTRALANFVEEHRLGVVVGAETGFALARNPDTVRGVDIGFVRQVRLESVGVPQGFFPGAPDLAVEVVSPGDTVYEVQEKVEDYLAAGCVLVWVVNPRGRSVSVYRQGNAPATVVGDGVVDGEGVLPGFRIAVAEIFKGWGGR